MLSFGVERTVPVAPADPQGIMARDCGLPMGAKSRTAYSRPSGCPPNFLALFQIVQYLRSFLFGRLGWSPMNAILIISGVFGVFHKDTVVTVGGYLIGRLVNRGVERELRTLTLSP